MKKANARSPAVGTHQGRTIKVSDQTYHRLKAIERRRGDRTRTTEQTLVMLLNHYEEYVENNE